MTRAQTAALAAFGQRQGKALSVARERVSKGKRGTWTQVDLTAADLSGFRNGEPAPGAIWAGMGYANDGTERIYVQWTRLRLIVSIRAVKP